MSRLHQLKRLSVLEPLPKDRTYAVERLICLEADYHLLPPQAEGVNRIVRVIIPNKPRTEPRTFRYGCEMENGLPVDCMAGDYFIDSKGTRHEIKAN